MIATAYVILALAAVLFVVRLLVGPTVPDRVVALDGLLITVMCGVLVAAADQRSAVGIDTVLVVALLGFIGTGVLARYVEQRGG
ncbi:MAG: monovalent cation/H+ antiporter complex subunit F [Ilumatobacter sp.]|uniref:monovalent cation/H+ antiporter complex subunit F n=1 Tax=Ilumatobacter sp. TaxID=1967498 RepID=UPI00261DC44F|nr:monovalent cation/H+ antiporter complex subunit F [Ilumatobacter sp.]MDJ0769117.1 monovalent cation/H+ antiporter complex subunit F [Ilumatobacter sp.]